MFKKLVSKSYIKKKEKEVRLIHNFYKKNNLKNKDRDVILEIFNEEKNKSNPSRTVIFALIIKAFQDVLNITPYDVQLIGAMAMDEGYMAELKTGEGKTYVTTLTAIYNSLFGKVYNVTINDYLAKRDYEETRDIYNYFNVNNAFNKPHHELEEDRVNVTKKKNNMYQENNVVFTSSSEFAFDYLKEDINFALDITIIDEADFVLIDNANSKFSVSSSVSEMEQKINPLEERYLKIAKRIVKNLKGGQVVGKSVGNVIEEKYNVDFVFSIDEESAGFTTQGIKKIENIMNISDITKKPLLYKSLLNMLYVNLFMIKNRDYIVKNDKITLINRANGRLQPNSKRGEGIQEALEIKEDVPITEVSYMKNDISYQLFFSKFKKMVGMSGTILDAEDEFYKIFKRPSISIPTNEKSLRKDYDDVFFKTKKEKYEYALSLIKKIHKKGQPLLVITYSEDETKKFSNLLSIKHNILNAVETKKEDAIIKEAGKKGQITISTNLAGRGTDIKISQAVENLGGLYVLSLNKFENSRIDNQVRGRAGRQGEKGSCLFLSSLEDKIFQSVETEKINYFKNSSYEDFYHFKIQKEIKNTINQTQKKVTSIKFKSRRILYEAGLFEDYIRNSLLDLGCLLKTKKYQDFLKEELLKIDFYEKANQENKLYILGTVIDLNNDNFLEKESILVKEKDDFIERKPIKKEKLVELILKNIENKIEVLSLEISNLVFNEIVKHIVKNNWYYVEKNIESATQTSNLSSEINPTNLTEFINTANEYVLDFKHFLIIEAFEKFLQVKLNK